MLYQNYNEFLRGEFWQDMRCRKLELNPRCESCNSTWHVHIHHKIYRKRWNETKIEDLQTLCEKCHSKHHNKRKSYRALKKIRKSQLKIERATVYYQGLMATHEREKGRKSFLALMAKGSL